MEQHANVSELAEQLGMTQSAVSHQLNLLKSNKLVRRRRDGKMIFYALVDEHVQMVIEKGAEYIRGW
ncbi:MAG: helix-turn-helix transcriptional regulator [Lachnospiraceae bacterium]|nr:helix-turn-helix transcriptional regulator [Lachnospiraceae bacterium]